MNKVLVLGSTGMAGHLITLYLQEKKIDVTGLSTSKCDLFNNIVCDVTDEQRFTRIILGGHYDYIINCIGLLKQAAEENKAKAIYLNSFVPHLVSSLIQLSKTKLIHLSTDCVFSGDENFYIESSFKDGKSFYDKTKAIGEIDDLKNLTFRTSIVGPDMNVNGIGLFNWFMKQEGNISGFDKVKWTGVTTLTLAKAIECVIKYDLFGLYNLVNNETITKYEMLKLFNSLSRKKLKIIQDSDYSVSKILKNTRQKNFNFIVPSYEEMIFEMFNWIHDHKDLYTHYFKKGIFNE